MYSINTYDLSSIPNVPAWWLPVQSFCDLARILRLMLRICIIFGNWIRIRISVKSWIWIRIRIKVKIQKFWRLRIEPCRAWTLSMEAWRVWLQIPITLKRSWIRIRVPWSESWIWIRFKVMLISNPGENREENRPQTSLKRQTGSLPLRYFLLGVWTGLRFVNSSDPEVRLAKRKRYPLWMEIIAISGRKAQ